MIEHIKAGKEKAKQSRCFIAGCARNIAKNIPFIRTYIEELGSNFADYRVYVFENDSNDDTPQKLKEWSEANWKVAADCFKSGNPRLSDLSMRRIEYMSDYRNAIMKHLEYYWSAYDYMIMVDLDICGFYVDGVINTLGWDGWDAVGSNGRKYSSMSRHTNIYYDIFGHKELDEKVPREGNLQRVFAALQDKYRHLMPGDPLIPVSSCFNGVGVYRVKSILGARYAALPGYAEHVAFHLELIKRGGSVFINPSQLTYYDQEMAKYWTRETNK